MKSYILFFVLSVFSMLVLRICMLDKKQIRNCQKDLISKKVELDMDMKDIKKVVLDNGLTILVFRNTQTPKVLLQIAYDIGSWVEQSGEKGMAHLIEHMIFKGTEKMSEGDIDSISRKYGADFNAFTSKDMTSYYFESDKNNWKPFVGILADCMQNARFDSEHLASEFKAVIQELRMYADRYWNVMMELAASNIYPSNHPYHYPIIGFKQDLVNITAEHLKAFYKAYYRPERATLFMVGDIDIEEAVKVATKRFKDIPNEKPRLSFDIDEDLMFDIIPNTRTYSNKIYEDVKKEQLGFYWLIPGLKLKSDELVSVVESVLGSGEGSRLYKRLVEQEHVASSVSAMGHQLMGAGIFYIFVEPLRGKSDECKKFITEELNKVIKTGITKEEINKVVKTKKREHFQQLQSLSNFTYEWITSFIATRNELDVFEKVDRFEKINSDLVQKFVGNFLDPFFINEIIISPLPEDKKDLWLKLKEQSEEMDKLILETHPRTASLEEPKLIKTMSEPNKLEFKFPKPDKELILENGLNVLLYENKPWPIFTATCNFKQSSFFAESKEGILLDFMMNFLMEGTLGLSKQENVDFFENLGATYEFDLSGGSVTGLVNDSNILLNKLTQILIDPDFPEKEFEKMRSIFIDLYERRNDSQTECGSKILKNLIYKNNAFDWTFEQALDLIKSVDVKKLKELHKKYVTPKNMVLSVVGGFDLNKVEEQIKNIFSSWVGEENLIDNKLSINFEPNSKVDKFMLRDQLFLILGRPSPLNIYHKDLVPVKMLDFIAFGSLGSRLHKLREETGLFYTASGMFGAGASRVNGFDYVGSILNVDNAEKSEKLFLEVIDTVGKNGVLPYELDASRQNYLKGLIDLTAGNGTLASLFARLKAYELGFDYYDKVLTRVQSITLNEINKIAKKYFNSKDMCRVRVGRIGEKTS